MSIITSRSIKLVVVVSVIFVSMTLIVLFGVSYGLDKNAGEKTIINVKSVEELAQQPRVSMPIESGRDAISFAVYLPSVLSQLRQAQSNIPYREWRASAFFHTSEPSPVWYVTLSSAGDILPSFRCSFSFTIDGNLLPEAKDTHYCAYNK